MEQLRMESTLDREIFAEVLGSKFTLKASGGQSAELELTEVTPLKERSGSKSYSLIFEVPESHRVEQGLFELEHPTLGELQIFLVPVGMKKARQELQAVFNFASD
jgi:hypothetical protein